MTSFEGTKDWPPHITLACYENINLSLISDWTKEYTARYNSFEIYFSSLGIFCHNETCPDTDVIYLVPSFSRELTEFYYGFHDRYDEYYDDIGWSYSMKYGQPAFHSSISLCKISDFNKVFQYLYSNFVSFYAELVALELYTIPMKLVTRFELGKKNIN
jgi:hypothetical protein